MQTEVGVKELLVAGVHFGHQIRRWHPKMRRYIFGERDKSSDASEESAQPQLESKSFTEEDNSV